MFYRIVTLLLTFTCYCSLGSTMPTHFSVYSVDKRFNALANRCANEFLVTQIKNKSSECNLTVPPFKSEQMQCLIFYDMSTQLCDAVDSTKQFSQDYLNKEENIDELCNNIAKSWKFSNLTDIPNYRSTVENVFNKPELCKKVCGVSEVLSYDTNSFCKYYKWGSEILKIQASTPRVEEKSTNNEVVNTVPERIVDTNTKTMDFDTANDTAASIIKNKEINTNNNYRESNPSDIETTIKNVNDNEGTEHKKHKIPTPAIKKKEFIPPMQTADEINTNVEHSVVVQKPDLSGNTDTEKILPEEVPPKKDDTEKEDQLLNKQKDMVKDDKDDLEDDADSEEEDKQDLQDDSEISIGKADLPKLEEEKKEIINSKIPLMTSYTAEKSQDFISKIPQDDFPEDDDHFISFFLTAVIVVVLLYILYHNKNKFTKVILGLIVEGRQHGRRRNSRGHAYRRLDTLEQAMSTNSPAPPSKIIY